MALRRAPVPALVVPGEQALTVWGHDPAALGLEPVPHPAAARALLAPERIPEELAGPLARLWAEAPSPLAVHAVPTPLEGRPLGEVLTGWSGDEAPGEGGGHDAHGDHGGGHGDDAHGDHGGDQGHDAHGDHDHGDMMAITGEPSADGLVMEPIELQLGPLAAGLPGGLVVALTLDGDVVASCEVRAALAAPGADPLAPAAASAAREAARERRAGAVAPLAVQWRRLAAVELERATSHLAWLRAFGRVLGWSQLVDAAGRGLAAARRGRPEDLAPGLRPLAQDLAARLLALVEGRRLALRARGRAVVDARTDAAGVTARAAGVARDTRAGDPLYAELGFAVQTRDEGDAQARAALRAAEAIAALGLAATALERAEGAGRAAGVPEAFAGGVEGPRGPVVTPADGDVARAQERDRRLAAEAATGEEWAAALVALASFDLSPWRVGAAAATPRAAAEVRA